MLSHKAIDMGSWGPGNFENDSARDYLSEFLLEQIKFIETTFQLRIENTPEDFILTYGDIIILYIDIIITLSNTYRTYPFIDIELASKWRNKFFETLDDAGISTFRQNSDKSLHSTIETFDRLDKLVAFWETLRKSKG
jgi:hypothetical protein